MILEKAKRSQRGRPISFDKAQLVDSVMHKFWELGYNKVSLNEIAKDHGLTRASLYHSFDSKEALFLQALQLYLQRAPDVLLEHSREPEQVGSLLFALFDSICKARAEDPQRRGCLVLNCMHELITTDSPLADHMQAILTRRQGQMKALVERAQRNGEINPGVDAELTGNMVINFLFGLNTFSKTCTDEQQLLALCEAFLNSLGFHRQTELNQRAM
ncbi:TetR/AcrR family transcriptional regulator [Halioxenophilus sp. WMMB6]|uniref:TetR/AcrR family transcriptional regulator n=1 Tax=Halioxenophilus sp. WMMB6 TaxID=3073815 RepID=UPI00295ED6A0|nr:TetR/AcrR family transcriptional regulator [Halioxenophilus sp. WMMB6]